MNRNKWKRLLSVLLAMTMILSWNVPAYAQAELEGTEPEQTVEGEALDADSTQDRDEMEDTEGTEDEAEVETPENLVNPVAAEVEDEVAQEEDTLSGAVKEGEETCDHNYVTIPAKDSTCVEKGHEEGRQCSKCGAWENGAPAELELAEHQYTELLSTLREATCQKAGMGRFECEVCHGAAYQAIPAGHVYPEEGEIKVAPTCIRKGEEVFTCTRYNADPALNKCDVETPGDGDAYNDVNNQPRVKTVEIDKTAHDYVKDTTNPGTPATCGEDGVEHQICRVCDETFDKTLTKTGKHVWPAEDETVYIPATKCGELPSTVEAACKVCHQTESGDPATTTPVEQSTVDGWTLNENGEYVVNGQVIYRESHVYDVEDRDSWKEPTCTEDGKKAFKCKFCGEKKAEAAEDTIAKLGHVYKLKPNSAEIEYTNTKETCDQEGHYTKHCTRCNNNIEVDDPDEIEKAGGSAALQPAECDPKDFPAIEATCKAKGREAGTECSVCGKITGGADIAINPNNHTPDETKTVTVRPATCENPGLKKLVCKDCAKVTYESVPATHQWDEGNITVKTEPTCTVAGSGVVNCSVCGATGVTVEIPALGHDFVNGTINTDESTMGDCVTDASIVKNCARKDCDVTSDPETVKAPGAHNFAEGTVKENIQATCAKPGKTIVQCKNCTALQTTEYPQLEEHGAAEIDFIDATCQHGTQIGLKCSVCKEAIAKAGSGSNDPCKMDLKTTTELTEVTEFYTTNAPETDAATIKANYDQWIVKAKDNPIDHKWTVTKVNTPVECEKKGSVDRICSLCNLEQTNVTVTRQHIWTIDTEKTQDPTCDESVTDMIYYKCTQEGCVGTKEESLDNQLKPDHIWNAGQVIQAETCGKNGVAKYTCTECGKTKIEVVKGGHLWDAGVYEGSAPNEKGEVKEAKAPTCTEAGIIIKTCSRQGCTKNKQAMEVAANGHTLGTVEVILSSCGVAAQVGRRCTVEDCKGIAEIAKITADSQVDTLLREKILANMEPDELAVADKAAIRKQLEAAIADPEAKTHTYGTQESPEGEPVPEKSTPATCIADGVDVYVCDHCGDELEVPVAKGDQYHVTEEEFVDATCAGPASVKEICTICEKVVSNNAIDDYTLPHDFATSGEIPLAEGKEDICVYGGSLLKVCKNVACGHTEVTEPIEPGHQWGEEEDVVRDGKVVAKQKVCQRTTCKAHAVEIEVTDDGYGYCATHGLQKLGEADIEAGKDATCTEPGKTIKKSCPVCKVVIQEAEVIPAGHDKAEDVEWTTIKEPNCGETGLKQKICSKCESEVLATEVLPIVGEHAYQDVVEPATCSTPMRYVSKCTGCGAVDGEPMVIDPELDPNNHSFGEDGTCTNKNGEGVACTVTAQSLDWKKCNVHGWAPTQALEAKAPTCEEAGTSAGLVCSKYDADGAEGSCQTIYTAQNTIPATGHAKETEVEWTQTKAPTCSEDGQKQKICNHGDCTYVIATDIVPKTDKHVYKTTIQDPTCSTPQRRVSACESCGALDPKVKPINLGTELDPDNHNFGEDGRCTNVRDDGTQCEEVRPGAVRECPKHGEIATVILPAVTMNCTRDGKTQGLACSRYNDPEDPCNTIYTEQETITKDPYAHKFDKTTETCEYCEKTGTQLSTEAGQEQLGKCSTHGWVKGTAVEEVEATCQQAGRQAGYKCPECTTETIIKGGEELPVTGHNFSESNECKYGCGTKQATLSTSAKTAVVDGNNKLTVTMNVELENPEDVVEMGILYITKAGYTGTVEDAKADLTVKEEEMSADGSSFTLANRPYARAKQYKSSVEGPLGGYSSASVNFNFGDTQANLERPIYARGYVIMKTSENTYAIRYADEVITGTVGSFLPAN